MFACLEEMATTFAIIGDIVESAGPMLTDDASMTISALSARCTYADRHASAFDRKGGRTSSAPWLERVTTISLRCSSAKSPNALVLRFR